MSGCLYAKMASLAPHLEGWSLGRSFLPTLVAFALASPASLRAWIAVRSLDPPAPIEIMDLKATKRRGVIAAVVAFTLFLGFEAFFISQAGSSFIEWFTWTFFVLLYQSSLMMFHGDLVGAVRWACFRHARSGRVLWHIVPGSVHYARVAGVVIFSTLINAQNAVAPIALVTFVVTEALVFRFVSNSTLRVVSIRRLLILFIAWIALSFLFSVMAFVALIQYYQGSDAAEETIAGSQQPLEGMLIKNKMMCESIFSEAVFMCAPGIIIAACYRFDYAYHLASSNLSYPVAETVQRRVCARRFCRSVDSSAQSADMISGAAMPSRVPSTFPRPLYIASLASWVLAQVGVMALFALAPMDAETRNNADLRNIASLAFSVPAVVVGVLVAAVLTGRAREMWTYREEWAIRPQLVEVGKIQLEDEEPVPAYEVGEAAPSYEDVKA